MRPAQHLINAVARETFDSEMPLGIITLDGEPFNYRAARFSLVQTFPAALDGS